VALPASWATKSSALARYLYLHSAVRFAVVGASNTFIDYLVLNVLLFWGVDKLAAVACGFAAGATNGYLLNSRFVFKTRRTGPDFARYFLVSLVGLTLTVLIVNFLTDGQHWMRINAAKAVAVVVVFFWNYTMSRFWAFRGEPRGGSGGAEEPDGTEADSVSADGASVDGA
jgi:putative flippase GtrA